MSEGTKITVDVETDGRFTVSDAFNNSLTHNGTAALPTIICDGKEQQLDVQKVDEIAGALFGATPSETLDGVSSDPDLTSTLKSISDLLKENISEVTVTVRDDVSPLTSACIQAKAFGLLH